jgi:hypothetical protein
MGPDIQGEEYKGIEFTPYVHFIKCDTEEADHLARKYTSRGMNVSQICRGCQHGGIYQIHET